MTNLACIRSSGQDSRVRGRAQRIFRFSIAAGLLTLPSVVLGQTPLFGNFGEPAWSRTFRYIESRLGAVAADDFVMVLPTATNAAWDDRSKPIRLMEMYQWGDWIPTNAWQYNRDASRRISEGYRYFLKAALLHSVDANGTASDTLKNAVRRSSEELDFARSVYNQALADADAAYNAYAAVTPVQRRQSKRRYFRNQGYDAQIDAAQRRLVAATDTFKTISDQLADPDVDLIKNALVKYDNPNQQISLPPVREAVNQPDLWQNYYASFVGKDIDAFLREDNPQTEDITETQSTSNTFESKWKASVSVKFLGLFRAGGASAEQVRREEHVRNNATRISISFANLDTFDIVRGEWYDGNAVSRFGPLLPAEPYKAVFGPNGQLEIIPKTLLVAKGMKFTVYADSDSLDYMYEHFSGSVDAGIRLGWWTIGGGGSYSSTKSETKVTKFTDRIEFEDRSGRAKVIAVLGKRPAATPPAGIGLLTTTIAAARTPAASTSAIPEWVPSKVVQDALSTLSARDRARVLDR